MKTIKVDYNVYTTPDDIINNLENLLNTENLLAFDVETRSVYDKELRKEATQYLKTATYKDDYYKQALLVSNSSGLSHPSIVHTTHFILSNSKDFSYIFVVRCEELELKIWNLLANYTGTFIIHNALFDLKIMHHRTNKLPKKYVDTSIYAKCFINHVKTYESRVGLKILMETYYDSKWTLLAEDYEPEDLTDKNFLHYCSIDGAATYYLYELIQESL